MVRQKKKQTIRNRNYEIAICPEDGTLMDKVEAWVCRKCGMIKKNNSRKRRK